MSSAIGQVRVAVLYQALEPPIIGGIQKPKKPGGYQDSGADIAYVLRHQCNVPVATPQPDPDPTIDSHWCFPDTETGILQALGQGATHLWANTILFSDHPLQLSSTLEQYADSVRIIGQPPALVEAYDDKYAVYEIMKANGSFTLTKSISVTSDQDIASTIKNADLAFPIIAKPVRGRGSHGVKLCRDPIQLQEHVSFLFSESSQTILEQYLDGEEATVTVMPPSASKQAYWAMPVVARFNHDDGVAPYNGTVAVTANSRVITISEQQDDPAYDEAARECERAAALLHAVAPIRIDIRRFAQGSRFALFDVNMKPNMTGPGRPGRENQASLTAMAAAALGWNYARLLVEILSSAESLRKLREAKPLNAS